MEIGKRLLIVRKNLNLTQAEFSLPLGVNRGYIATLETSDKEPSETLLKLISYEYGISYTWLRTGEGEMYNSADTTLKNIMSRYNEQDIIEAFSIMMKERGLAVAAGRYSHRADTGDPELDYMLNALYSLWSSGDADMKGWIKIQFGRAFPKDVIDETLKKHKGPPEQTFVG